MKNRKFYTCCFTGHRPKNLPWEYNEKGISFLIFKFKLTKEIKKAIKNNYCNFISGMALGVDILAAKIILKLKKSHPNITLECAIPCKNQTLKWQQKDIAVYNQILSKADTITYVSNENYFNGCMQKRNEYMIDNSSLLIAVFNGKSGGTQQTINLAKKRKIYIKILKL